VVEVGARSPSYHPFLLLFSYSNRQKNRCDERSERGENKLRERT